MKPNKPKQAAQKPLLDRTHVFSPALAKSYGANAAVLLGHIANWIAHTKHEHDAHRWMFYSAQRLHEEQFPYIPTSTIAETLKRLVKHHKALVRGKYNKRGGDRTWWYAFAKDQDYKEALSKVKRIQFSVQLAVRFKAILPAVLVRYLAYWVKKNRQLKPDHEWQRFAAHAYATRVPFSKGQIDRALKDLVRNDVLESRPCGGTDKAFLYRFKDASMLDGAFPEIHGADLEIDDAFLEIDGTKLEIDDLNPDDVTCCKTTVERTPLEDTPLTDKQYKETPPAAPSGCFVAPETEGSKATDSSHDDTVATVAAGLSRHETAVSMSIEEALSFLGEPREIVPFTITATDVLSATYEWLESHVALWEELFSKDDPRQALKGLHWAACRAVSSFLKSQSDETLLRWNSTDHNELLHELAPMMRQEADTHRLAANTKLFFYALCVTRLVRILQSPDSLKDEWRKIGLTVYGRTLQSRRERERAKREAQQQRDIAMAIERDRQIQAELKGREAKYASPDIHREDRSDLSPAEKVNVFRNAILSLNRIGEHTEVGWRTGIFKYSDASWRLLKVFFELNPDVAVSHLLSVLSQCQAYFDQISEDGYDPNYYLKSAQHLTSFLKGLEHIVSKVQMVDELPPLNYLPIEIEET